MNIEFIKWMCEKADWKWEEGYIMEFACDIDPKLLPGSKGYYPLLLQRAIEGVNREGKSFLIKQDYSEIYIMPVNPIAPGYLNFYHSGYQNNYDTIDKAKEAALMYIYKQESN